eukprot:scaffold1141_cov333-Pavlova_lutheri.AAC.16
MAGAPSAPANPTPANMLAASITIAIFLSFRLVGGAARAARALATVAGRTAIIQASAVIPALFRMMRCAIVPHTAQDHTQAPIVRHGRSSCASMAPVRLAFVASERLRMRQASLG